MGNQSLSLSWSDLRTNPRKLLHLLYEQASLDDKLGYYITAKLTRNFIAKTLDISVPSVRTACRFLTEKQMICQQYQWCE